MAKESFYSAVLLDHFRHSRNKGELDGADIVRRGHNPRCGDEIEVGLYLQGEKLAQVKFRGRGCSVCMASASMMTEAVTGCSKQEAYHLWEEMRDLFGDGNENDVKHPTNNLQALSVVREYPARQRCVLISWEALRDALRGL
ncbi:MAG: SUF system NifU family Fe-S cluster assembly protein [Gammaproteobacteria bacterium HGW-Gammaproteobacteria-3]|nr:MAG: SUF system NifU family Fe-S cluster assembly protein [Gammaproteobacteria bacterium HGW-Gammaproteobacteria-3]